MDMNDYQRLNPEKKVRTQGGIATTEVIVSSYREDNAAVFARIFDLHLVDCRRIADITYGKGVFWRRIDTSGLDFLPSDIKTGTDFTTLPYEDESLDAVVFDPPYMEGFYRRSASHLAGEGTHDAFRNYYSNGEASTHHKLKYHDVVLNVYIATAKEVKRVLKNNGVFVVKCQDEVSANRQKLTHAEILYAYDKLGFYCKDLFVVTRTNRPGISRLKRQKHARKNHSYFLVFRKNGKNSYSNFRPLIDELVSE